MTTSPSAGTVAHMFWHGTPLSPWTRACLASFVRHGFEVRLHSFADLAVPPGVQVHDAAQILPLEMVDTLTHAGVRGSLACFSDFFRYKLLAQEGGWWFDTDVVCLAPSDAFAGDPPNVAGFENASVVANGVLTLEPSVAHDLFDAAMDLGRSKGWRFAWGDVGPRLVTRHLGALPSERRWLAPTSVFYPYESGMALQALDPDRRDEIASLANGARTFHLWNEILTQHAVPRAWMPPAGSFVHEVFVELLPTLAEVPTLPSATLRRLMVPPYPTLADLVRWAIDGVRGRPIS